MILIIESSADFPSVALCDKLGVVHYSECAEIFQSHSEKLPVLVQNALNWCENNSINLDGVAVNKGPGSYTGLRIGVSLAKGLCYSLQIPLIAVDGIEAMSQYLFQNFPEIKIAYSMIDARRDEVFMKRVKLNEPSSRVEAIILDETIREEHWNNIGFIGNSNQKAIRILGATPAVLEVGPFATQMASEVAKLFSNEEFENVAYFEPYYLKDFVPGISKKFAV